MDEPYMYTGWDSLIEWVQTIIVSSTITYLIVSFFAKKRMDKLRLEAEIKHRPNLEKLARFLLYSAVKNDARKIVFGVPAEPCPGEENASYKSSGRNSEKKTEEESTCDVAPYTSLKNVPVWFCDKKRCFQVEPLSVNLFCSLISYYIRNSLGGICLFDDNGDKEKPPPMVDYVVTLEDNYCFSVRILNIEHLKGVHHENQETG